MEVGRHIKGITSKNKSRVKVKQIQGDERNNQIVPK